MSAASASAATVLKREPAEGKLVHGQRVLVDDGSCPAGQIKEVMSGSNRVIGTGERKSGVERIRRCVKR